MRGSKITRFTSQTHYTLTLTEYLSVKGNRPNGGCRSVQSVPITACIHHISILRYTRTFPSESTMPPAPVTSEAIGCRQNLSWLGDILEEAGATFQHRQQISCCHPPHTLGFSIISIRIEREKLPQQHQPNIPIKAALRSTATPIRNYQCLSRYWSLDSINIKSTAVLFLILPSIIPLHLNRSSPLHMPNLT